MNLERLIQFAARRKATDLHLESGLPPAIRVRGEMAVHGDPVPPEALARAIRGLLGTRAWEQFLERRSYDLSRTIAGVRCRVNALDTSRGPGLAIRLLSSFQPTIERLNLHPDLRAVVRGGRGLILVCGPTGSGKSSTLAALIHEINVTRPWHVLTLENPIEYAFRPRKCFIRQREVGRDTPSFEQGLHDALRQDPDVLMVGEMRDPETIRLTLNAAETGHLVLSTLHASSGPEAVNRLVNSFPSGTRSGVCAQLADCLSAVISQRLVFRPELNLRIPELQILRATGSVRTMIRQNTPFKLESILETGAADGQWTFRRYREWARGRGTWFEPEPDTERPDSDIEWAEGAGPLPPAVDERTPPALGGHASAGTGPGVDPAADPTSDPGRVAGGARDVGRASEGEHGYAAREEASAPKGAPPDEPEIIEIEPTDQSIGDILSELDPSSRRSRTGKSGDDDEEKDDS